MATNIATLHSPQQSSIDKPRRKHIMRGYTSLILRLVLFTVVVRLGFLAVKISSNSDNASKSQSTLDKEIDSIVTNSKQSSETIPISRPTLDEEIDSYTTTNSIETQSISTLTLDDKAIGNTADNKFIETQSISIEGIQQWCNRGRGSCPCRAKDALEPKKRDDKKWQKAFEMNIELANSNYIGTTNERGADLDVVLMGDSITERWNGRKKSQYIREILPNKNVLKSLFRKDHGGKVNGIALGIGGDRIEHLLWRIQNGEVPESLKPKVFWLLIGTNDLAKPMCSTEFVFIGIIKCVEELLTRKPNSIIVLNSILPRTRDKNGLLIMYPHEGHSNGYNSVKKNKFDFWPMIETLNKRLKEFAALHDNIKFYNATDFFLERKHESIFIDTQLMRDRLHPTASGYKLWGDGIVNYLVEEIGV